MVERSAGPWAMAEMTPKIVSCVAVWSLLTLSLQVDLVLCSVILCTVVQ